MTTHKLGVESLDKLDLGKGAKALEAEIKGAVRDILDRPGLKKTRTVNMQIEMTPKHVTGEDGAPKLDHVGVRISFDTKLPKRHTMEYAMGTDDEGNLLFNDLSPTNPHQRTMPMSKEEAEEQAAEEAETAAIAGSIKAG